MAGTSSDSGSGVSGILFSGIQDSLRTHGCSTWAANWAVRPSPACEGRCARNGNPRPRPALPAFAESKPMPYALFSNDAKLSKAYPTEADVGRSPGRAVSWSMWPPRRKRRTRTRCWTMITRSGPATLSRMKILPGTRRKPSATTGPSRSSAHSRRRRGPSCQSGRDHPSPTALRSPAKPAQKPASRRPCAGASPGSRR
jgi:hypothetical protein